MWSTLYLKILIKTETKTLPVPSYVSAITIQTGCKGYIYISWKHSKKKDKYKEYIYVFTQVDP